MENYEMEEQFVEEKKAGMGIRDFLTIFFKRRTMILSIFFSTVVITTVVTLFLPTMYEATSTLLVRMGREYLYRPEVGGDKSPMVSINQGQMVDSEIALLTSRDLVKKVITSLTVQTIYPDLVGKPLENAVMRFQKNLTAIGGNKTTMIEVSFQHKDPRIAAKAVNLLVDLYKEKHLQVFNGSDPSFLDKQLDSYEKKLKESTDNLESFKRKNQVFSPDEQRTLLLNQRSELDTELKSAINNVEALQRRLVSLKGLKKEVAADSTLSSSAERDRVVDESKSKLFTLQLEEQELLKKYKEENRLVQNVRNQIKIVKGFVAEQEQPGSSKTGKGNSVYLDMERERVRTVADLSSEQAKIGTMKGQMAQIDGELQVLEQRDKEMQNLKSKTDIMAKSYQTYAEKKEESSISEDMNRNKMANVSVVQTAEIPVNPVKSKKRRNLAMGLGFGAAVALGLAFLLEFTSQVFSTPESAEKYLGLPVLATIALKK